MTPALHHKFYTGPIRARAVHRDLAEESFTVDSTGYANAVSVVHTDRLGNVSRCKGRNAAWYLNGVLSLTVSGPNGRHVVDESNSLSTGSPILRTHSSVPVEEAP